jgi:preprotein translocase subunit SecE
MMWLIVGLLAFAGWLIGRRWMRIITLSVLVVVAVATLGGCASLDPYFGYPEATTPEEKAQAETRAMIRRAVWDIRREIRRAHFGGAS